ncbi:hypothetical protein [Paenibacillus sp. FSL H8-0259]|uniref:hypothetical protein n=1 Tax=Paenibacillus sp. FSL H8-0259 TaxID=1920423 RepID=UPI002116A4BC|nr:hypothetical protein [Paenibacillus sp. FSL H8-0259]
MSDFIPAFLKSFGIERSCGVQTYSFQKALKYTAEKTNKSYMPRFIGKGEIFMCPVCRK